MYALDLPGFGGVPASGQSPTAAFFADQVEGVLDHYRLDDPVLIGHSMGTQVVTEVLARRPGLSHAVLVSPVVDEAESTALVQGVRFVQSTARESIHIALLAVSAYLLCGFLYFFEALPHMLRYRISDRIGEGRATLLLIRGEYDRPSPRRLHSRLVARARTARRWEIEGAAHCVVNSHAVGGRSPRAAARRRRTRTEGTDAGGRGRGTPRRARRPEYGAGGHRQSPCGVDQRRPPRRGRCRAREGSPRARSVGRVSPRTLSPNPATPWGQPPRRPGRRRRA